MFPVPIIRAVGRHRTVKKNFLLLKSFKEIPDPPLINNRGFVALHNLLLRRIDQRPPLLLNKTNNSHRIISPSSFTVLNQSTSTKDAVKKPEAAKPAVAVEEVTVYFIKNGVRTPVKTKAGSTILDIVVDNMDLLDMDGFGACEGTLACSTCHVILKKQDFQRIPNKPSEEELDMLDLAYDLTDT